MTFHDNEHRINNTGWITEWRWNGGVERKAKPLRECWTFFNLHFPASAMEAMSGICACKIEKNLQIFGWCLQFIQSCLWATLSYFCLRKQGRKSTQWGESSLKNVLKTAQRYLTWNVKKSPCELNLLHCRQEPRPLCETGTKRGLENKENAATG